MGAYNRITIMGNLGADSELRIMPDGRRCLRFTVAVNHRYKDKNQRQVERSTWFQVQEWRNDDNPIGKYLVKGQEVLVSGRMDSYKYTNREGVEHTAWAIIPDTIQLTGKRQTRTVEGDPDDEEIPVTHGTPDDGIPF